MSASEILPGEHFASFAPCAGARFHRADLHVHSYGISPDVSDEQMTPSRIVQCALECEIGLLAITDHNAIGAVASLCDAAGKAGLAVLAGIELTSADGHLLAYFDPEDLDAFERWFARLDFKENAGRSERWLLSPMHVLAEEIVLAGGVAVPAHVGRKGTGVIAQASAKALDALISSASVYAFEVDGPDEYDWFSPEDRGSGSQRRSEQMSARRAALGETSGLARVYFSDAHELAQIGRGRGGGERLTRIKMTEPSFEAFKLALCDPDARVRIEEQVPENYSRLIGARFLGGFLDGQEIAFSENLTCLIGGRGAGKSTALEAVRCSCLDTTHKREEEQDEEWPAVVQLEYEDHFGERHRVQRERDGRTSLLQDGELLPYTIPIEGYAQDRVAEIIRDYGNDDSALAEFLDGFAELASREARIEELRSRLHKNADEIAPLATAPARRQKAEARLAEAQLKLKAVEESKLKEALNYRRRLEQERRLRATVRERLERIKDGIDDQAVELDLTALGEEVDAGDLRTTPSKGYLFGRTESPGLSALLEGLQRQLVQWRRSGQTKLETALPDIEKVLADWEVFDAKVEKRYQDVLDGLRAQGVNPDERQLARLTQQEAKAKDEIAQAKREEALLKGHRSQRRRLLVDYRAAQEARYQERRRAMRQLTEELNEAISEFKVKLWFRRGERYAEYEVWLRKAMNNRFFRAERIASFCRAMHPIELANIVVKRHRTKLQALTDEGGAYLEACEIDDFMAMLTQAGLNELEAIDTSDAPAITLTTAAGGEKPRAVEFGRLSFGQKASILLGALLCSKDTTPLIIDQPEDHLDSAFIYETIVGNLRAIKERRQVILATHNANIAVLGDAELIAPLQGYGDRGRLRDLGAVDAPDTRERACKILEGGPTAYRRRGEMYGLPPRS